MLRLHEFEVATPTSVAEALAILDGRDDAVVVAGGTDLVPKMKRGQMEPALVVSLEGVGELRGLDTDGAVVRIGALTTLRELEQDERVARFAALRDAVREVATPIIRTRATLGGNLLQDTRCRYYDRSPFWREAIGNCMKKDGEVCRVATSSDRCLATFCSDVAPALVVLDAQVVLAGKDRRTCPLEDIYRDDGITYFSLDGSLLTEVVLEDRGMESAYRKLRMRGSFDFPEVGVAVALSGPSEALAVNVAVTGVGSRIVVVRDTVAAGDLPNLVEAVFKSVRPVDTMFLSPAYRKKMAQRMLNTILDELLSAR
jgi:4-hydroxybenzoyl-CoA reductase subunit beta